MSGRELPVRDPSTIKRLNVRQIQHVRSLIDVNRVVRRLQGFALSEWELARERDIDGVVTLVEKPIEMNAHQVRAAGMLLDRVLPVLQSVQLEVSTNDYEGQSIDSLKAKLRHILAGSEIVDVPATNVRLSVEDLLCCNEDVELKKLLDV